MSSTDFLVGLGDFILWTTQIIFENIGNLFNNGVIILGFIGLFYWLNYQKKFNQAAKDNPDQIK